MPCAALALQTTGTACRQLSPVDADLHKVIAAWQNLSANVRGAILSLVDLRQVRGSTLGRENGIENP
jgi:hypothetical protein